MNKLNTFEDGAIMMASELIANCGDPCMIGDALIVMGVTEYDATELTDFDQMNLKQIKTDGFRLRIHED